MTLDKLIKSVEGLNGIEITDDTLVIRKVHPYGDVGIGDYSFKFSDIEDYKILFYSTIDFWLKPKGEKVVLIYKNGTNENTDIPWRIEFLSTSEITHYSWE